MSTKIDYVITRRSKLGDELFFQNESAVIGGYSDSHMHTPDFLRGPLLEPAILPFRFRRRLFRDVDEFAIPPCDFVAVASRLGPIVSIVLPLRAERGRLV